MDPKAEQRMVRALERLAAAAELYALVAAEELADPSAEEADMSDVEYARRVVIENQCDDAGEGDLETP
jgi:hypothetical protein